MFFHIKVDSNHMPISIQEQSKVNSSSWKISRNTISPPLGVIEPHIIGRFYLAALNIWIKHFYDMTIIIPTILDVEFKDLMPMIGTQQHTHTSDVNNRKQFVKQLFLHLQKLVGISQADLTDEGTPHQEPARTV